MDAWKKEFSEKTNLTADFAPNYYEQKVFKFGYDYGYKILQSELTRLKTGITDILSRRLHPEQTEREIKEFLKTKGEL